MEATVISSPHFGDSVKTSPIIWTYLYTSFKFKKAKFANGLN